jgi:MFS family permease
VVPFLFVRDVVPTVPRGRSMGVLRAFMRSPTVFAAAFAGGVVEIALWALLPLFAMRQAADQDFALLMVTVFIVGGVALQWLLGWIADRMDRRLVVVGCALLSLAILLTLPATVPGATPWLLLPFLGGALTGFYTLGLALLGERFEPASLAAANTAFIMLYEIGRLTGPPLAGAAMEAWNPHGLIAVLAVLLATFAALAGRRHLGFAW